MTTPNNTVAGLAEKLLPCPFCGGRAKTKLPYVRCVECGGQMCFGDDISDDMSSVAAWNRRASPAPSDIAWVEDNHGNLRPYSVPPPAPAAEQAPDPFPWLRELVAEWERAGHDEFAARLQARLDAITGDDIRSAVLARQRDNLRLAREGESQPDARGVECECRPSNLGGMVPGCNACCNANPVRAEQPEGKGVYRATSEQEDAEVDLAAGLVKITMRLPIALADRLNDEAAANGLVFPAYVRQLLASAPAAPGAGVGVAA